MPPPLVQRSASLTGLLKPAITAPFPLTATLYESVAWPSPPPSRGRPRSTIPPALVQRKARNPTAESLVPTTTEPSSLTSEAYEVVPPGSVPRSTMPPADVHWNAWLLAFPTTTEPSRLTPDAPDDDPPGRNP